MPVRLLRYSEIDLTAWDACVDAARQAVPYACSWWLHATAGRWDALVETDEESGRYRSVWPLPTKWRPWGQEVYQPPFTQQLGLVQAAETQFAFEWGKIQDLLLTHYTRFYAQLNDGNELPAVQSTRINLQARHTYHLALHQPYEALRAAYSADYRRRLRLNEAAAAPLVATETQEVGPLLELFQQTKGPAAGLKTRHYALLRRLMVELKKRRLLELLEVRQPTTGALLAGALFVRYRTRLVYLFAAASEVGKKAGAPVVLLDHQIRRHAGVPALILDFEGGMIPSIARFFANFGAVPVSYAALSFTQRPWYLKWTR